MAATTFRNLQDLVLSEIGKSDTTTRNRVKDSLNLGQSHFVLRELWPTRETTGTLNLVQGTQEYSLSTNFTDIDLQNIISVTLQGTVNSKLVYWSFSQLRASQPDFDLSGQAVPARYYLKGGNIGFWPVPDAAHVCLIDYYALPTEMSADSDEPSLIPLNYREALVKYSLASEHRFNTDFDLAQQMMNDYEDITTLARQNLLSQPVDTGNFRILGPADSRNHTGLNGELA